MFIVDELMRRCWTFVDVTVVLWVAVALGVYAITTVRSCDSGQNLANGSNPSCGPKMPYCTGAFLSSARVFVCRPRTKGVVCSQCNYYVMSRSVCDCDAGQLCNNGVLGGNSGFGLCYPVSNFPGYGQSCHTNADCRLCDTLSHSFCVQLVCMNDSGAGSCQLCDPATTSNFTCSYGTDSGQQRFCIGGVWSSSSTR